MEKTDAVEVALDAEYEGEGDDGGDDGHDQGEDENEGLDLYDDNDIHYGATNSNAEYMEGDATEAEEQPTHERGSYHQDMNGGAEGEGDDEEDEEGLDLYEDVDVYTTTGQPADVSDAQQNVGESGARGEEEEARGEGAQELEEAAAGAAEEIDATTRGQEATDPAASQQANQAKGASEAGAAPPGETPASQKPASSAGTAGATANMPSSKALVADPKSAASEYMARHGLAAATATAPTAPSGMIGSSSSASAEGTMLFVGELHWWTKDSELEAALAEFGRVKELKFFEEKASGKSKGYCQVEFADSAGARACKEKMNGRVFHGRACVVAFASPSSVKQMGMAQQMKHQVKELGVGMQGRGNRGGGMGPDGPLAGRGMGARAPMSGGRGGPPPVPMGPMPGRGPVGMRGRGRAMGRGNMGGPYGEGMMMGGPMVPPGMMGGPMPFEAGYEMGYDPGYDGSGGPMGPGYGMVPGMGMPAGRGYGPRGGPPPYPMGPGGPGFGGMPPLPVAPHINPAFFGRGMNNGGPMMEGGEGWEGGVWEGEYGARYDEDPERARAMLRERRRQGRVEEWESGMMDKERRPGTGEMGHDALDEELEEYAKRRRHVGAER